MRLSRSPRTITVWLILFALCSALPAAAQTGVIAFRDDCSSLLHVMRGDGSGSTALRLPPLPGPAAEYRYVDPWVLDVTTSGPLTVVYYVGIVRRNDGMLMDSGLFAVQVSDIGGRLVSDSPRRLLLPATVGGVNPKIARHGAFSAELRDRLALVVPTGGTSRVFMTAKVDRDANRAITGLSDFVVLGDFTSLGEANPFIDYASDGSSIVLSISSDLYRVHLAADNTMIGAAELLTPNTEGFAEWNPSCTRRMEAALRTPPAQSEGPVAYPGRRCRSPR